VLLFRASESYNQLCRGWAVFLLHLTKLCILLIRNLQAGTDIVHVQSGEWGTVCWRHREAVSHYRVHISEAQTRLSTNFQGTISATTTTKVLSLRCIYPPFSLFWYSAHGYNIARWAPCLSCHRIFTYGLMHGCEATRPDCLQESELYGRDILRNNWCKEIVTEAVRRCALVAWNCVRGEEAGRSAMTCFSVDVGHCRIDRSSGRLRREQGLLKIPLALSQWTLCVAVSLQSSA
jgi:hypothetical protein